MEILDNVGKIVSDTYKSATKASSKLIEESKLKFLISDNEAQMKEIYQNIGKEYCRAHFEGKSFDETIFENDFEELKRMQQENDEAKEKILNLKGFKKCVKCNKDIKTEYAFCQHCGERQPEPEVIIEEEVKEEKEEKVCSSCEAKLNDEDLFCPFCGKSVE